MANQSNEQLCLQIQQGGNTALEQLIDKNQGFINKTANEIYEKMSPSENDLGIILDDLVQEGRIGIWRAASSFDASKGIKFLTYAAPTIRNAMTDLIRTASAGFEYRMTSGEDGIFMQRIDLDEVLPGEDRLLRIEAVADPFAVLPEKVCIKREMLRDLYAALKMLDVREQTYLLYRYGFTDDICHPLTETALHFHLSESRARKTEALAMDNLWLELPWWFR